MADETQGAAQKLLQEVRRSPREAGSWDDTFPPRFDHRCHFPPHGASSWVDALRQASVDGPPKELVHEWTATLYDFPPVPGDSEYFEKLEARHGTGAIVLGRYCTCAGGGSLGNSRIRYSQAVTEAHGAIGFRVAVALDGGDDPCEAMEAAIEHGREVQCKRERRAWVGHTPQGLSSTSHETEEAGDPPRMTLGRMLWEFLVFPFLLACGAMVIGAISFLIQYLGDWMKG
jgi:hypothetical protein